MCIRDRYSNSDEAERHLQILADMGWGHWQNVGPGKSGGRPTRRLKLVPVGETQTIPDEKDSFDDTQHANQPDTGNSSKLEEEGCVST